ncbi:MAG: T9SS type A sorting domain-containing protein [Flavobacteriales bacterium]|nr:T9SS type A sorting domain-containing protein [Flavobacteriales bacterium]
MSLKELSGNANMKIYGTNGQIIKEIQLGGTSDDTIALTDIAAGCYLVKLTSNGETVTKKVIVR